MILFYYILVVISIADEFDEQHNFILEDPTTNKLRICDNFAGPFIEKYSKDLTSGIMDVSQKRIHTIKHFYYIINNCYAYLSLKYNQAYIDDAIVDQIDWVDISKPFQFYDYHFAPNYELSQEEEEIQQIMKVVREKIKIEKQNTWQYYGLSWMFYLNNSITLSVNWIVVFIMIIFFGTLIYAFSWLIMDMMKSQKQKLNPLRKQPNQRMKSKIY